MWNKFKKVGHLCGVVLSKTAVRLKTSFLKIVECKNACSTNKIAGCGAYWGVFFSLHM